MSTRRMRVELVLVTIEAGLRRSGRTPSGCPGWPSPCSSAGLALAGCGGARLPRPGPPCRAPSAGTSAGCASPLAEHALLVHAAPSSAWPGRRCPPHPRAAVRDRAGGGMTAEPEQPEQVAERASLGRAHGRTVPVVPALGTRCGRQRSSSGSASARSPLRRVDTDHRGDRDRGHPVRVDPRRRLPLLRRPGTQAAGAAVPRGLAPHRRPRPHPRPRHRRAEGPRDRAGAHHRPPSRTPQTPGTTLTAAGVRGVRRRRSTTSSAQPALRGRIEPERQAPPGPLDPPPAGRPGPAPPPSVALHPRPRLHRPQDRQDVPAVAVRHPHPALLRAGRRDDGDAGRPAPLRLRAGRAGRAALRQADRPVVPEPAPGRRLRRAVLRHRRTPEARRTARPLRDPRHPPARPGQGSSPPPPTPRCGGPPPTPRRLRRRPRCPSGTRRRERR